MRFGLNNRNSGPHGSSTQRNTLGRGNTAVIVSLTFFAASYAFVLSFHTNPVARKAVGSWVEKLVEDNRDDFFMKQFIDAHTTPSIGPIEPEETQDVLVQQD